MAKFTLHWRGYENRYGDRGRWSAHWRKTASSKRQARMLAIAATEGAGAIAEYVSVTDGRGCVVGVASFDYHSPNWNTSWCSSKKKVPCVRTDDEGMPVGLLPGTFKCKRISRLKSSKRRVRRF